MDQIFLLNVESRTSVITKIFQSNIKRSKVYCRQSRKHRNSKCYFRNITVFPWFSRFTSVQVLFHSRPSLMNPDEDYSVWWKGQSLVFYCTLLSFAYVYLYICNYKTTCTKLLSYICGSKTKSLCRLATYILCNLISENTKRIQESHVRSKNK